MTQSNKLSELLNPEFIGELKKETKTGRFKSIGFEDAMTFFLTDGILPKNGLSAQKFLDLESWALSRPSRQPLRFSATELKNKTGEILNHIIGGKVIHLVKHGRLIAEIRPLK